MSDGQAIAEALFHTENCASFALCEGAREIAVIEANDNRFLFSNHHQSSAPRPLAIRSFELLFLASIAFGVLHVLIGWTGLSAQLPDSFRPTFAILLFLTYGLFASLCLLISRRRSAIAKWSLLAIFAYIAFATLRGLLGGRMGALTPISLIQCSLELLALLLLFTPTSRRWMSYS